MTNSAIDNRILLGTATAFEHVIKEVQRFHNPNIMTGDDWLNVFIEVARQLRESAEATDG